MRSVRRCVSRGALFRLVRVADGVSCSTNHHCVNSCVQQLSTADKDFIKSGFYAKEEKDEIKCPEIELNRLDTISDVTARVKQATEGKSGEDYSKAEKAVKSDIEKECVGDAKETTRCDVVDLYHGGIYDVYKYHRYQDVRLVFAPELAMAFFGGDPDNFNFPRYDLDMGVLRAYESGKPAVVKDFFPFSKSGADENELTIVVGNPGGTDRQLTVAQLETTRDVDTTQALFLYAERRGMLEQFRSESAENHRIAQSDLFGVENSYKALRGRLLALQDPEVFNLKRKQEAELRDYINADPARKAKYGAAWDEIAKALVTYRNIETRYQVPRTRTGFRQSLFRLRACPRARRRWPRQAERRASARIHRIAAAEHHPESVLDGACVSELREGEARVHADQAARESRRGRCVRQTGARQGIARCVGDTPRRWHEARRSRGAQGAMGWRRRRRSEIGRSVHRARARCRSTVTCGAQATR